MMLLYPVPAPRIFTYGTASDLQSPPYYSSVESVTLKGNPTPHNKPHNLVPNVPFEPEPYPSFSDSSLSDSSDSSDGKYYKQRQLAKKNKEKQQNKTRFHGPIKKCTKLTAKLLTSA